MDEKKLVRLRLSPKGDTIVNIDHITEICKGPSCITLKMTNGKDINIDYTMQSIVGVLPIK